MNKVHCTSAPYNRKFGGSSKPVHWLYRSVEHFFAVNSIKHNFQRAAYGHITFSLLQTSLVSLADEKDLFKSPTSLALSLN